MGLQRCYGPNNLPHLFLRGKKERKKERKEKKKKKEKEKKEKKRKEKKRKEKKRKEKKERNFSPFVHRNPMSKKSFFLILYHLKRAFFFCSFMIKLDQIELICGSCLLFVVIFAVCCYLLLFSQT